MTHSQAIVEALVAKAAEVLCIEVADVLSPPGKHGSPLHASARAACYQVLREGSWQLVAIGAAFRRNHSTVHHQETKSRLLVRVDPEHAYLVSELRRLLRELTQPNWHATLEERVHAQVWALDQEIASSDELIEQIQSRKRRAQILRGVLLADFPSDVITRAS